MSIYSPPTQNVAIFDTELFKTSDRSITQGEADKRYLRFPIAQGTETLQTIAVNGVATFNNNIDVNGLATFNGGLTTTDRAYQELNADPSWNDVNGYYGLSKDAYPALDPYSSGVKSVSTWNTRASSVDNQWLGIVWAAELGLFVAVATTGTGNRVMTSPDGITWTTRVSAVDNSWRSVVWAPELGLLVAVAFTGTNDRIMTSPDGIVWTSRITPTPDRDWGSLTWAPELGLFVAVANSATMTSPDGINWTEGSAVGANTWFSVTWAAELGLLVAVSLNGANNRVMTSPDGITWTGRTSASNNNWRGVTWSPELGLFAAVANSGTGNRVMTSPDGINWTSRTTPADNDWLGICWSAELGLFAAVAVTGTNRIMTSPDGINWTERTAPVANEWRSIVWAPELGIFAAVSQSGTNDRVMTSSLTGRPPTSYNVFDSSFNNIDSNGNWTLKSKSIFSDTNITIDPSNTLIVDGILDVSGNTILRGTLTFPDNKVQNSAFTGGTAGTYTNTNMTIDANGRISAISNGTVVSIPFAPRFANYANYQTATGVAYSQGTKIVCDGSWGNRDYIMIRVTAQGNWGDTGSGWQYYAATSGQLIFRPHFAPSGVWASLDPGVGTAIRYPSNTQSPSNAHVGNVGKAVYYTGNINNGNTNYFTLGGVNKQIQFGFQGPGITGGWEYTHLIEYIVHSTSGGTVSIEPGTGSNNILP